MVKEADKLIRNIRLWTRAPPSTMESCHMTMNRCQVTVQDTMENTEIEKVIEKVKGEGGGVRCDHVVMTAQIPSTIF